MKIKIYNKCTFFPPVLKTRFPDGMRTQQYKRTRVEELAPYVSEDGQVARIMRYKDFNCTKLLNIEERYENRADKLCRTVQEIESNVITDYHDTGREDRVISKFNLKYEKKFWESQCCPLDVNIYNYFLSLFKIKSVHINIVSKIGTYINNLKNKYYLPYRLLRLGDWSIQTPYGSMSKVWLVPFSFFRTHLFQKSRFGRRESNHYLQFERKIRFPGKNWCQFWRTNRVLWKQRGQVRTN